MTEPLFSDAEMVELRCWLLDINRALRDVFTASSDEDEAFDDATRSLDLLWEFLGVAE
jgi:hypothetical protein